MLNQLDDRLKLSKQRLRSKQKLESMLRQARQTAEQERSKCLALRSLLSAEKADVDKLDGLSLTSLFYTVLGSKEERLETERREFLAAKLKYDEAVESLKHAEQEVQRLEEELKPFADVEADYDRLIEKKQRLLADFGNDKAETLLAFTEKLADLQSDAQELLEAIQAGEGALNSLRQVSSDLGSAAGWGTWDLLGGGMISTMVKHSKIDTAKQNAHLAQRELQRFQKELADADQRLHLSLEIGGFCKFADYFFDGLIADWMVQSKIRAASQACSSTISEVSATVNACRRRLAETEQGIDKLEQARQEFVEEA